MSEARTHFDVFELPPRYALDAAELERRYREQSRQWHPDRFGRAPASERAQVLQRATDLNEAYRVLKSDTRRAEYLLKLHGVDVTKESPDNKLPVDPAFLMEILELREELLEARHEKNTAKLRQLSARVATEMTSLGGQVAAGFAQLETATQPSTLAALTQALLARRYFQRFADDIAAYEEAQTELAATQPTEL